MDTVTVLNSSNLPIETTEVSVHGDLSVAFSRQLTAQELQTYMTIVKPLSWSDVRNYRNALITAQEWKLTTWALTTVAEKERVLAYIQLLRDIPQTYATPDAVIWPEEPA